MRLRTVVIVGATLVGLIVTLYAASHTFLLGQFIKLEQQSTLENLVRAKDALNEDIDSLDSSTANNSVYDVTYDAMGHPKAGLIRSVVGDANVALQRFNFIFFIDSSAHISEARGIDLVTGSVIDIPKSLTAHISVTDALLKLPETTSRVDGIVLLPEGP